MKWMLRRVTAVAVPEYPRYKNQIILTIICILDLYDLLNTDMIGRYFLILYTFRWKLPIIYRYFHDIMYFHIFSSVLPLPPRRTPARWTGRVCSTRSPSSGSTRSCPPGTSAASRNPSPVSVNILELETKVAEDSAKFYMVVKSSGTFGKPSFEALLATLHRFRMDTSYWEVSN